MYCYSNGQISLADFNQSAGMNLKENNRWACIIQAEYVYSDEETALQLQENPYLQYFCGYPGYNDEKLPFAPFLMVHFRKQLTPEILGEINEMILQDAQARQCKETASKDDDDDDSSIECCGRLVSLGILFC